MTNKRETAVMDMDTSDGFLPLSFYDRNKIAAAEIADFIKDHSPYSLTSETITLTEMLSNILAKQLGNKRLSMRASVDILDAATESDISKRSRKLVSVCETLGDGNLNLNAEDAIECLEVIFLSSE